MILHVDNNSFDEVVSKGVVLVDFWATWCGPCRMIAGELEKLDNDSLVIAKVDCDTNEELCQRFQVSSIPTLLVFKDGKLVNRSVGFRPAKDIEKLL